MTSYFLYGTFQNRDPWVCTRVEPSQPNWEAQKNIFLESPKKHFFWKALNLSTSMSKILLKLKISQNDIHGRSSVKPIDP